MAKNTGENKRIGMIVDRSQTFNPKTQKYVKRDATTGKFIACKDTKFKGVRSEEIAKKSDDKKKTNKSNKSK